MTALRSAAERPRKSLRTSRARTARKSWPKTSPSLASGRSFLIIAAECGLAALHAGRVIGLGELGHLRLRFLVQLDVFGDPLLEAEHGRADRVGRLLLRWCDGHARRHRQRHQRQGEKESRTGSCRYSVCAVASLVPRASAVPPLQPWPRHRGPHGDRCIHARHSRSASTFQTPTRLACAGSRVDPCRTAARQDTASPAVRTGQAQRHKEGDTMASIRKEIVIDIGVEPAWAALRRVGEPRYAVRAGADQRPDRRTTSAR